MFLQYFQHKYLTSKYKNGKSFTTATILNVAD